MNAEQIREAVRVVLRGEKGEFLTTYQIAIALVRNNEDIRNAFEENVGGAGRGHRTLAKRLGTILKKRLPVGVEMAVLSSTALRDISYRYRGHPIVDTVVQAGFEIKLFRVLPEKD